MSLVSKVNWGMYLLIFFESPLGYQLTLVSQETVKYYAVARGGHLGIHCTWVEFKLQVIKFNGARK